MKPSLLALLILFIALAAAAPVPPSHSRTPSIEDENDPSSSTTPLEWGPVTHANIDTVDGDYPVHFPVPILAYGQTSQRFEVDSPRLKIDAKLRHHDSLPSNASSSKRFSLLSPMLATPRRTKTSYQSQGKSIPTIRSGESSFRSTISDGSTLDDASAPKRSKSKGAKDYLKKVLSFPRTKGGS